MVAMCSPSPLEMGACIYIKNWGVYNPDSSSKHSSTSSRKNSEYAQSSFWKILKVRQCQTGGFSVCVWVCLETFLNKGSEFRVLQLHGSGLECSGEIGLKNPSILPL